MNLKFLLVILYLIVGFYFINYSFNFVQIPALISNFNNWIITVGGVLIILSGVMSLASGKHSKIASER